MEMKRTAVSLIVTAGDMKIDNARFKKQFGFKARMLGAEEVAMLTGHEVGGVCPFANPEHVTTYLDVSHAAVPPPVFPAAGSASSAIELTCEELFKYSQAREWIDVCKAKDVQAHIKNVQVIQVELMI